MAEYRSNPYVDDADRTGRSFIGYSVLALKQLARNPERTTMSVALSALVASPLYAVAYQGGSMPFLGWVYAVASGSAVTGILIAKALREAGYRLFINEALVALLQLMFVSMCVAVAMFLGMSVLPSFGQNLAPVAIALAENTQAYVWKPMAHVAVGSVIVIAVAPSMLVALPLRMLNRLTLWEGFVIAGSRAENRQYSWIEAVLVLVTIATIFVWIPIVGLLVPAIVASLSIEIYREVFSTKPLVKQ